MLISASRRHACFSLHQHSKLTSKQRGFEKKKYYLPVHLLHITCYFTKFDSELAKWEESEKYSLGSKHTVFLIKISSKLNMSVSHLLWIYLSVLFPQSSLRALKCLTLCVGCWPCRVAVREINLLLSEHPFDTSMHIIMSNVKRAPRCSSCGTPAPTSSVLQKVKKKTKKQALVMGSFKSSPLKSTNSTSVVHASAGCQSLAELTPKRAFCHYFRIIDPSLHLRASVLCTWMIFGYEV